MFITESCKKIASLTAISIILVAPMISFAQRVQVTNLDSDYWFETTKSVSLQLGGINEDGLHVLTQKYLAPEGTLLSVDTRELSNKLARYNDLTPSEKLAVDRSKKFLDHGILCGVTLVDIQEDPHETLEDVNPDNNFGNSKLVQFEETYCLKISDFEDKTRSSSGNGEAVLNAYESFQESGDVRMLLNISNYLENFEPISLEYQSELDDQNLLVEASSKGGSGGTRLISPILGQSIGAMRSSITSHWNPRRKHPLSGRVRAHRGTDIGVSNEVVIAVLPGTVIIRSFQHKGAGKYIVMRHPGNNLVTKYFHLSKFSGIGKGSCKIIKNRRGKTRKVCTSNWVNQGQQIAVSGATGGVNGPHLHFETWIQKQQKGWTDQRFQSKSGNYRIQRGHNDPLFFYQTSILALMDVINWIKEKISFA